MTRYKVYGVMTASVLLGEYEADSEDEAQGKADLDKEANFYPSLCSQCSHEVELGEIYKTEAFKET